MSIDTSPFHIALRQSQRNLIEFALETAGGDWYLACERLGLPHSHFRYYCEQLGFPLPAERTRVGASRGVTTPTETNAAVVDLDAESPHDEVIPAAAESPADEHVEDLA